MTARVLLPVPGHDHALTVIRHGHYGRPVLVFPSEAGRADDIAERGLLEAVWDLVDAGRVSLFCVDSLDAWTWSARDQPTEERARRHGAYHAWLEQQVLPWIDDQLGGPQDLITLGMSLGAYHAVHFTLQRADRAPTAIGLSGNYDPSTFAPWGEVGDATYVANPTAYLRHAHGEHLAWLRRRVFVLLVCGQGPWETHPTGALPSTRELAQVLSDQQIPHEMDLWGHDSAHDWPWWQRQLGHHLPRFV